MHSGLPRTREEAALLLGVSPSALPEDVRRAFRVWAALSHPDQGGSAESFMRLCAARDALLRPVPPQAFGSLAGDSASGESDGPRPRTPWRQVLVRPPYPVLIGLVAGAVASTLSILAATFLPLPWGVLPAALASALWCVALSRAVLCRPDHGHVIVTRTLGWTVVVAGQLGIAMLAGIRVVEVLPVLALPFVLAIAAVNPAAGLWRGATR